MIHPTARPYSVRLTRVSDGGQEARKSVQVHARSPQGARAEARRLYPGWRPYAPRAI